MTTPMPYIPADPAAPYGRDPATGAPLSDKSAMLAGLLQFFFGQFGAGRWYLGDFKRAGIMLGLWATGVVLAFFIVGLFVIAGVGLWGFIDGIMIMQKKVPDAEGRMLR